MREQKKMIIPVLYGGIDPDKVPFYVSNGTYIQYLEDPNYLTKINGIEGDFLHSVIKKSFYSLISLL